MTWGELKKLAKALGVKDSVEVHIDVGNFHAWVEDARLISSILFLASSALEENKNDVG